MAQSFENGRTVVANGAVRVDGESIQVGSITSVRNQPDAPAFKLVATALLILFAAVSLMAILALPGAVTGGIAPKLLAVGIFVLAPIALVAGLWNLPIGKAKHMVSATLSDGRTIKLTRFKISAGEAASLTQAVEREIARK
ncbi:MAG: hypothetical protein AAGB25_03225 [Pseudomonadota bacterium]